MVATTQETCGSSGKLRRRAQRLTTVGVLAALSLTVAATPERAAAQSTVGTPAWTRQFGTAQTDQLVSVASNRSGMVFAAGYTTGDLRGTNLGGGDAVVVRFDSSGNRKWTAQFGGPEYEEAVAVATSSAGDVYVAGYTFGDLYDTNADVSHSHSDAFLAKFDRNGRRKWMRQLGSIVDDNASAVTVSSRGDIYVTGTTEGQLTSDPLGGTEDAWVAKYDRNGNLKWLRQFGTLGDDGATGIAIASTGAVLVAGRTSGSIDTDTGNLGGWDIFVSRFDAAGTWVSSRQWGSITGESAYAIAAGPNGSAYVAGWTSGTIDTPAVGDWDAFVSRIDVSSSTPDLTVVWSRQLGTAGRDWIGGIAVNSSAQVFVTGTTAGSLGGTNAGGNDAFTARFDAFGSRAWIDQIGTASDDRAEAISAMPNGNLFVAGSTQGNLGGANSGDEDALILRYSSGQARQWVAQVGSDGAEYFNAVAAGRSGSFWAVGSTNGSYAGANIGLSDALIAHFDGDGHEIFAAHFGTNRTDYISGVAGTPDGGAAVVGVTQGDIDGTHSGSSLGSSDAFVAVYRADGSQAWIHQFGTGVYDNASAVAVAANGDVYVLGVTAGTLAEANPDPGRYDIVIIKYDRNGVQRWIHQFGSAMNDFASGLALTPSGYLFLAGDTAGDIATVPDGAGGGDAWLARYDRNGNRKWIRQFGGTNYESVGGIATNSKGEVFVAGSTGGDFGGVNASPGTDDGYVAKFDKSGKRKWVRQFGTDQADTVYGVSVSASGTITVTGTTEGSLDGSAADDDGDVFITRYSKSGTLAATRQFGTADWDTTEGIAPTSGSGVVVVGATSGTIGYQASGGADAFIARLDW